MAPPRVTSLFSLVSSDNFQAFPLFPPINDASSSGPRSYVSSLLVNSPYIDRHIVVVGGGNGSEQSPCHLPHFSPCPEWCQTWYLDEVKFKEGYHPDGEISPIFNAMLNEHDLELDEKE